MQLTACRQKKLYVTSDMQQASMNLQYMSISHTYIYIYTISMNEIELLENFW